jgi:hypothetical protein
MVAVLPETIAWLAGCVVIDGGELTVTVAVLLVFFAQMEIGQLGPEPVPSLA